MYRAAEITSILLSSTIAGVSTQLKISRNVMGWRSSTVNKRDWNRITYSQLQFALGDMDGETLESDLHANAQPDGLEEFATSRDRSFITTFNVPTNSRTTVMIDQSNRICTCCND
jgi:hypothetical protein